MNSEWAEPPEQQGQPAQASTPGAQLAAQRQALGWSVEQIADQLKLATRQVKAIEAADYASLPNMAVVRGFVRAYAKVVKLDAAPLVAMIEVAAPVPEAAPARREISATFSESRFPTLTERSSKSTGWIALAVVALAAAGFGAYRLGYMAPGGAKDAAVAGSSAVVASMAASIELPAPIVTTVASGPQVAPLQSPSVPLISVPAPGSVAAPATAPATAPAPALAAAAVAPAVAPTAISGKALVLTVTQDSWVEIRRTGAAPLVSRLITAGSTETFDIKDAALLIVGKPDGVKATLDGVPLALPAVPGGTVSRVHIK